MLYRMFLTMPTKFEGAYFAKDLNLARDLAGITRKKMTSASSGWALSTIGLVMRPMLLGLCASPLKTVFGQQGLRALGARAVRWRFEMKTTTDLASSISACLYLSSH
jgi:hypothetical protein